MTFQYVCKDLSSNLQDIEWKWDFSIFLYSKLFEIPCIVIYAQNSSLVYSNDKKPVHLFLALPADAETVLKRI